MIARRLNNRNKWLVWKSTYGPGWVVATPLSYRGEVNGMWADVTTVASWKEAIAVVVRGYVEI